MTVILIFIILLNIVSIVLMYYCLADLEKKEKLIFIAAGTAIMYILTSIVYWISTNSIEMSQVSETGRDLIVFLFVPINGILVLPLFAKSYYKYATGTLNGKILRNRGIALLILLIIVLIIECVYFKNIQEQVVNLILEKQNAQQESGENNTNQILNEIIQENGIDAEVVNDTISNVTQDNSVNEGNVSTGSNATEND